MSSSSEEEARRARAEERRSRVILRKARLADAEVDLDPIQGAAAISLAAQLSLHAWSLTGQPLPSYPRSETPLRWVRRTAP